jgi:Tol biopolymer transport system component
MPDLSPDGKKLAFSVLRAGKWELWEKSLDGGRESLLSSDGRLRQPNWSPDGKRIQISSEDNHENHTSLIDDGGGSEQRIPIPPNCNCSTEAWSPDQHWLVGEGWDRNPPTQGARFLLFFLRLPTTTAPASMLREITSSGTDALYEPRVSPDGNWVTFEAIKGGAIAGMPGENPAIFVVPASGGEWISIAGGNSWNDKPRWSPDGRTIYFLSTREGFLNVWGVPFDARKGRPSGQPFQLTRFGLTGSMIADRDMTLVETSFGGNALAVPMNEASGSIWMLDNIDR